MNSVRPEREIVAKIIGRCEILLLFAVPAPATPSERVWSAGGNKMTPRRQSLSEDAVRDILLLHENSSLSRKKFFDLKIYLFFQNRTENETDKFCTNRTVTELISFFVEPLTPNHGFSVMIIHESWMCLHHHGMIPKLEYSSQ